MASIQDQIHHKSCRRSIAHRVASPSTRAQTRRSARLSTSIAGPSTQNGVLNKSDLYDQLMALEQQEGVIWNVDLVFCERCDVGVDEFDAIAIRNCLHYICITCIRECIRKSASIEVACPVAACDCCLQDREIRSLLTQIEYADHMQKVFETSDTHLYEELKNMEERVSIIHSTGQFECEICVMDTEPDDGMMLRECLHQFCVDCIRATINNSDDAQVKCPGNDCEAHLCEREIRSLLTQAEFDKYMEKTLRLAEATIVGSYHCKKPNCNGWCIVEDNINTFQCPCCGSENCLSCQVLNLLLISLEMHLAKVLSHSDSFEFIADDPSRYELQTVSRRITVSGYGR